MSSPKLKRWMELETPSINFEGNADIETRILASSITKKSFLYCTVKETIMSNILNYLALSYYDRLLFTDAVPILKDTDEDYRVRAVAMSCLFIAIRQRKRLFENKDMGFKFDLKFGSRSIKEEDVYLAGNYTLEALGPLSQCVNPFFFLSSFLSFIGETRRSRKLSVVHLLLGSQNNIATMAFLPSERAASAVMICMRSDLKPQEFVVAIAGFIAEFELNITRLEECSIVIENCFALGTIPTAETFLANVREKAIESRMSDYNSWNLKTATEKMQASPPRVLTNEEWQEQELLDLKLDWISEETYMICSSFFPSKKSMFVTLLGWVVTVLEIVRKLWIRFLYK